MVTRRVLIADGSAHGSTAEIAEWIGETLRGNNFIAEVHPAADVHFLEGYDAVVLGGALYATRWHHDARRFARRHQHALRSRPIWLFSSGPLDESADAHDIPPTRGVARIARRIRRARPHDLRRLHCRQRRVHGPIDGEEDGAYGLSQRRVGQGVGQRSRNRGSTPETRAPSRP